MANNNRQYGAVIFTPRLSDVLLVQLDAEDSWRFPALPSDESVHVVAAATAAKALLGLDISDKLQRTQWIEAESAEGALVRLYLATGVARQAITPLSRAKRAAWVPLYKLLPAYEALAPNTADASAGNVLGESGEPAPHGSGSDDGTAAADVQACPALEPFLPCLKRVLDKHPEWRAGPPDPQLVALMEQAMSPGTPPPPAQLPPAAHQGPTSNPHAAMATAAAGDGSAQGVQALALMGPPGSGIDAANGGTEQAASGGREASDAQQQVQQEGVQAPSGSGGSAPSAPLEAAMAVALPCQLATANAPDGNAAAAAAAAVLPAPGGGCGSGWVGPRPREHLLAYCQQNQLPEPCYTLLVKKQGRRPMLTASCLLPHLGVQITPDRHFPGGMDQACQAAALAAILWLEGGLPAGGSDAVRVVPVGWPPLLASEQAAAWEEALVRRAEARKQWDRQAREALISQMDKKRQRLVAEQAELERLMAALKGGDSLPMSIDQLAARLGEEVSMPTVAAAAGGGAAGDAGPAADVVDGMRALQFQSRQPGTKRPREDSSQPSGVPAAAPARGGPSAGPKSAIMELKELCDRRKWAQPVYVYGRAPPVAGPAAAGGPSAAGQGQGQGAASHSHTAALSLPAAGLAEVGSGAQATKKRAKEAAAAAALARLGAMGVA